MDSSSVAHYGTGDRSDSGDDLSADNNVVIISHVGEINEVDYHDLQSRIVVTSSTLAKNKKAVTLDHWIHSKAKATPKRATGRFANNQKGRDSGHFEGKGIKNQAKEVVALPSLQNQEDQWEFSNIFHSCAVDTTTSRDLGTLKDKSITHNQNVDECCPLEEECLQELRMIGSCSTASSSSSSSSSTPSFLKRSSPCTDLETCLSSSSLGFSSWIKMDNKIDNGNFDDPCMDEERENFAISTAQFLPTSSITKTIADGSLPFQSLGAKQPQDTAVEASGCFCSVQEDDLYFCFDSPPPRLHSGWLDNNQYNQDETAPCLQQLQMQRFDGRATNTIGPALSTSSLVSSSSSTTTTTFQQEEDTDARSIIEPSEDEAVLLHSRRQEPEGHNRSLPVMKRLLCWTECCRNNNSRTKNRHSTIHHLHSTNDPQPTKNPNWRRCLLPPRPIRKSNKPLTVPRGPKLMLQAKYGDKPTPSSSSSLSSTLATCNKMQKCAARSSLTSNK
ncbi:hypothetical protein ACA910_011830 [Epithemia clementina (nom. ined.)]